ncbi:MAG: alpha/beta hydrolase-fold protein [Bacteroidota bacterium]|nr:alpha/beta hydrolase-fold protein [Bacteroidota bacterium]
MKVFIRTLALFALFSCRHGGKTTDELYSRHLQRQVKLTILHTPAPGDRSQFNLLILNDGQDMEKFRVKESMDSLYKKGRLLPLVIIGIDAGDSLNEFGVAGKPDYLGLGNKAGFYDAFINDELYPYAKKQSGVRKFRSVAIAGCSLGGLSAFDIAWNHPDKISKVGIFSGSFWWRDKALEDSSYSDENDRIMYSRLKASRKKPGLQYWFYAGGEEEKTDRDKDGIIDVIDDTKDIMALLQRKNVVLPGGIVYKEAKNGRRDYNSWSAEFPDFLLWAFGN